MKLISPDIDPGYRLLHEGAVALSAIEAAGMRVDVDYLDRAIEKAEQDIKEIRSELRQHKFWLVWRRRFGADANLDSREQLGTILFDELKMPCPEQTTTGRYATDETVLESLNSKFVKKYLKLAKLEKARGTYLLGIRREVVDGFVHPVFNLHTVVTYRSSSDTPNFQNMPIRNPVMGELIRRCFIAREGHVIVENDFKGVEVSIAACYHKDPVMITYIEDPTKDMHRDMAMQIYMLTQEQVTKQIRHAAKNKFVFPQFYGDWYLTCAKALWDEIDRSKLVLPDGTPLKEHLRKKGITSLGQTTKDSDGKYPKPVKGTFVYHLQQVENDFWKRRFKKYGKWKDDWYDAYLKKGYFDTYTGFRVGGVMRRNEVINYPVQGAAFHCLLWSLIRIQRELKRRKMRTKIVGQIHDSMVADVHLDELDEYLELVREVTNDWITQEYKWIVVPLVIECEISPIGGTWYHKREVKHTSKGYTDKDGKYVGTARGLVDFWQTQTSKN